MPLEISQDALDAMDDLYQGELTAETRFQIGWTLIAEAILHLKDTDRLPMFDEWSKNTRDTILGATEAGIGFGEAAQEQS